MPRTISALMAVCVIAVAAPAFAQQGKKDTSSGGSMVFVGYSIDMVQGDAGVTGITQACGGDFGESARVCTTEEFMLSPNIEAPAASAWVLPKIILSDGNLGAILDFSGAQGLHANMTCFSWTKSVGAQGTVVTAGGGVTGSSQATECDVDRPVTCCAPAP